MCFSFSWHSYVFQFQWTLICVSVSVDIHMCFSFSGHSYVFQFKWTLICVSAVNVQTTDCPLNQHTGSFSFPPLCENMHSEDVSAARMTRLVFVTSSSFHQTADLARQYVVGAVGVAGVYTGGRNDQEWYLYINLWHLSCCGIYHNVPTRFS